MHCIDTLLISRKQRSSQNKQPAPQISFFYATHTRTQCFVSS